MADTTIDGSAPSYPNLNAGEQTQSSAATMKDNVANCEVGTLMPQAGRRTMGSCQPGGTESGRLDT